MKIKFLFREPLDGFRACERIVYVENGSVKEALFEYGDNATYTKPYAINEIGAFSNFEHHPNFIDLDRSNKYERFLRAILLNKTRMRNESFFKKLGDMDGVYIECPARRTPLVPSGYKSVICYGCHAVAFKTYEEAKSFFKVLKKMAKKNLET